MPLRSPAVAEVTHPPRPWDVFICRADWERKEVDFTEILSGETVVAVS